MMQALLLMQKTDNYLAFIQSFISFACNISQFGSLIEPRVILTRFALFACSTVSLE